MKTQLQIAIEEHQSGQILKAQGLYEQLLDDEPENSDALHLLGVTFFQTGQADVAVQHIAQAIKLNPFNSLAYVNLGNALAHLGHVDQSIYCYDCAIKIDPLHGDAFFNRGLAQQSVAKNNEALVSFDQSIAIHPGGALALLKRGDVLHDLARNQEAVASYDACILLTPDDEHVHYNRGVALQTLGSNELALKSYGRAIHIRPGNAQAWNNLGNTYQSLDLYQSALASYHESQNLDLNYADSHWNEALCLLKTGDFDRGWEKYEWRWANTISNASLRHFSAPRWLGQADLQNKSILLHSEQGLGDTIQFCRYANMVMQRGAKVTLQVPQALHALLTNLAGVQNLLSTDSAESYDFQCPLLSLPLAFGTQLASIPAEQAYLYCDSKITHFWGQALGHRNRPRVGLVWAGNRNNPNDHARSLSLTDLSGLLGQNIQWCSLHKDTSPEERRFLDTRGIPHFESDLTSFAQTAALIDQMDVVISVDTSVAHLAAALGKPTWLLLAHQADFRWLLGRRDSPWYPTILLFRQSIEGDWTGLLAQLQQHINMYFDVAAKIEYRFISTRTWKPTYGIN